MSAPCVRTTKPVTSPGRVAAAAADTSSVPGTVTVAGTVT